MTLQTNQAVGQLVCSKSDCRSRGCELDHSGSHTFLEIDNKMISTIILLFPLIQERLLSVKVNVYVHKVLAGNI